MDDLRRLILQSISHNGSDKIFENFQRLLSDEVSSLKNDGSSHKLSDLKKLTTKQVGDYFELICQQYLLYIYDCDIVYTIKNLPNDLREELGLRRQDMGIDLIARKGKLLLAIQSKYRGISRFKVVPGTRIRTNVLPWSELSTFYALVERTGPFHKHVVITSAESVRRVGNKKPKDLSICKGSFEALTINDWYLMLEIEGNILDDEKGNPSKKEVRSLRLKHFLQESKTLDNRAQERGEDEE